MANLVKDEGPLNARFVVVGEAPGRNEDAKRRPFVGPSGFMLGKWWEEAGLDRKAMYLTNVVSRRPAGNDITKVPKEELAACVEALHRRLAKLTDPYVIVPTGNTALKALTGYTGITNYRGSILSYNDLNGRSIRVIPTLHPAFVMRGNEAAAEFCVHDWKRIAREVAVNGKELNLPKTTHTVFRGGVKVARAFLEEAAESPIMTVDIETVPKAGIIHCVGFGLDGKHGFVVPTLASDYGNKEDLEYAWNLIRKLCGLATPKVLQNGFYDQFWLRKVAHVELKNYRWDLRAMHHCLNPRGPHTLAHMASMYTRFPYWKSGRKAEDREAQFAYNGVDDCVQIVVFKQLHKMLKAQGKLELYKQLYRSQMEPLFETMSHGVAVDSAQRETRFAEYTARCKEIAAELEEMAGEPLVAKKGLSDTKVKKFLFETLGLPEQYKKVKGERKVTADKFALRRIALRYGAKKPEVAKAIPLMQELRRKGKLAGTFLAEKLEDSDARVRCEYKIGPTTLRLASSKNPLGKGGNLQNVDREVRDIYVPDPGCVFLEVDASQAESRVVGMLTRDPELIRLARSHPAEFDVHKYNAGIIFAVSEKDVTKEQRYLGKRAVHASNYGMRGKKLAELLLEEEIMLTPEECQHMIDRYLAKFPAILGWQAETRRLIREQRVLVNSWGHMLSFAHSRLEDETYREGYAFVPQSEVGISTNQRALIPLYHWLKEQPFEAHINLQVHDSVVVSVPWRHVADVAEQLRSTWEVPTTYYGQELIIPCSYKVGMQWGAGVEFKAMPSRKQLIDAAREAYRDTEKAAQVVPTFRLLFEHDGWLSYQRTDGKGTVYRKRKGQALWQAERIFCTDESKRWQAVNSEDTIALLEAAAKEAVSGT